MQNFFKLFSLDETYDIDLAKLDEEYFTLQAMYHPDKTTSLRANEMSAAIHGQAKPAIHAAKHHEKIDCFVGLRPSRNDVDAILINQGYNILKDDFERAAHILELHGIFIKDDKLAPKLPPETLEKVLEMREASLRANAVSAAIHGQAKPAIHDAKHHEKVDCFVGLRPPRNDGVGPRDDDARPRNDVDQLRSAISTAFAAKDYHRAALKVLELRFLEK